MGSNPITLATNANLQVEGTTTVEQFVVLKNGNVGIGTTSTQVSLSFGGNVARAISVERATTVNNGVGLTISAGSAILSGLNREGGNLTFSAGTSTGNVDADIIFQTPTPSISGTTDNIPSTKMVILGNGRVGIGTTAPTAILDVFSSDANAMILARTDANNGLSPIFVGRNTYSNGYPISGISLASFQGRNKDNDSYSGFYVVTSEAHTSATAGTKLVFQTNENGTKTSLVRMVIENNGNVGINLSGSALPTSKLHVVGLPGYASDAAAGTGGLTSGAFYQTFGHATLPNGVIMVKQ